MNSHTHASVFRRVAAFLYDCLLLLAIFFIFTALVLILNNGNAIENIAFKIVLIPVAWVFFAWFWVNGGQTLGMRAWRIKLINNEGQNISWRTSVLRFVTGFLLFAVTYVPALFSKNALALHDKLSNSRIIYLKKDKKLK